jgi:hypothetical protein
VDGEYFARYAVSVDMIELIFSDEVAGGIMRARSPAGIITQGTVGILVCTYDGSGTNAGMKIFYEGNDVTNARVTTVYTAMSPQGADLWIGRYSTNYWFGNIWTPMVFGTELSPMQVKALTCRFKQRLQESL